MIQYVCGFGFASAHLACLRIDYDANGLTSSANDIIDLEKVLGAFDICFVAIGIATFKDSNKNNQ